MLTSMDPLTSTSEARKRQQYARPRHVSTGERNHYLATIVVKDLWSPRDKG